MLKLQNGKTAGIHFAKRPKNLKCKEPVESAILSFKNIVFISLRCPSTVKSRLAVVGSTLSDV